MTREYLGAADFATATIRSYMRKGLTPPADVQISTPNGPLRGWSADTIDAWLAARPGRGARTDLRNK
mgnify:CR=1 FL=1